jgi:hypothetical protein
VTARQVNSFGFQIDQLRAGRVQVFDQYRYLAAIGRWRLIPRLTREMPRERSTRAAGAGIRDVHFKGFVGSKTPNHAQRQREPNALQTAPLYAAFSATPVPTARAFERPLDSQAVAPPGPEAPSYFPVFPDFRSKGLARSNANIRLDQPQAPNVSKVTPIPVHPVTAQAKLNAPGSWLHPQQIGASKDDEPARRRIKAGAPQNSDFDRLDVAAFDNGARHASTTTISSISENPRIIGRPLAGFPETVPGPAPQFVGVRNSATMNTWRSSARLSPVAITSPDAGAKPDRIQGVPPTYRAPYPTASPSPVNGSLENSISTVGAAPDSSGIFPPDADHLGATDDSANAPGELWFDTGALGDWVQTYLASQIARAYRGASQPRP